LAAKIKDKQTELGIVC